MRRGACGLAAVLAVLAAAAPGDAATVSVSGTTVIYQAAPGEVNKPLVDTSGTAVVIGDSVAPTFGPGCAPFGATGAKCSGGSIRSVVVNLGDRDDSMARNVLEGEVPAGARLAVEGGPGKDFIIGTTGSDTLSGGSGDDSVYGSGGRDVLKGGSGNDRLTGFGTLERRCRRRLHRGVLWLLRRVRSVSDARLCRRRQRPGADRQQGPRHRRLRVREQGQREYDRQARTRQVQVQLRVAPGRLST